MQCISMCILRWRGKYIYKKGEEFIEIKKKIAFCTINNTHVSICIKSCKIIVINNYLMHINIYICIEIGERKKRGLKNF